LAGFESRFWFGYKHYGPFSEDLADTVKLAAAFDLISERQQQASWGERNLFTPFNLSRRPRRPAELDWRRRPRVRTQSC
jgi:hypothetical protein